MTNQESLSQHKPLIEGATYNYALTSDEQMVVWSAEYVTHNDANPLDLDDGKYAVLEWSDSDPARLKPAERLCALPEHENVATVYSVASVNHHDQVWHEPLEGGMLSTLLEKRGALKPEEVTSIVSGLIQGIRFLHSQQMGYKKLDATKIGFSVQGTLKFLGADRELRGVPEAIARSVYEQNESEIATLIWQCICGKLPGERHTRISLPLHHPEYGTELPHILEKIIDQQKPQPALTEVESYLNHLFSRGVVDLFASAHSSAHGQLPAVPLPEKKSMQRKPAGTAKASGQTRFAKSIFRRHPTTKAHVLKVDEELKKTQKNKPILSIALALLTLTAGITWYANHQSATETDMTQASQEPTTSSSFPETTQPTSAHPTTAATTEQEFQHLIDQRNQALNSSDTSLISYYTTDNSELAEADYQLITSDTAKTLDDVKLTVSQMKIVQETDSAATIEATLVAENYDFSEDEETETVALHNGKPQQHVVIELERTHEGWRIDSATPQKIS